MKVLIKADDSGSAHHAARRVVAVAGGTIQNPSPGFYVVNGVERPAALATLVFSKRVKVDVLGV